MAVYNDYKATQILGFDSIPYDWDIKKVKYLFSIGRGRVIAQEELMVDGIYPVYSSQTQNNGCLGYINSFDFDCDQLTWTTDGANAGTIFIRSGKHNCTNVCGTLQLKSSLTSLNFIYYALQYAAQFYKRPDTNGAKIMNNEMAEIGLATPSILEQQKIIEFLDHETAQIDTLIEKQQTLIQLLKEKRQAVISHAVTKGLNPDAPMKDSGVEWLGEVPEHWVIMQFRRITSLSQGLQIPQSERIHEPSRNNVEYITIKSIHAGDTLEHREYINKPSLRVQCDYDDVLLARTGATGEVVTGVKGAFHNNFFKIDYSEKITKDFLVNMLKVQELKSHLLMLAGTTTIPDLNHGAFLSTVIALPSLDEQEEICLEISRLSEKYNLLLEVANKQVKLLRERRTALISAAVTGKIDVRGWRAAELL